LDEGLSCAAIARWLNENGVPYSRGKWQDQIVRAILTHARYTGSVVFNRKSERLRTKKKWNPPDQWVIQPKSFPAVVSQKRFDAVAPTGHPAAVQSQNTINADLGHYLRFRCNPRSLCAYH